MKIRIKKVPRQPNIEAYGGLIDAIDKIDTIENNMFAGGGNKDNDEDIKNLMFYLSQKEKYPNGRKKTDAEKFLNYRLGIPERKTAPWFEKMPTYIPESPSEHLDRVISTASKLVKGIGEQTKKKTSQGEPYIPHVKFNFGGNMGTNSADFSTGLTHIDAGLSHEENPNEGVQVGVDAEGTPNLVEEGETIYNDYVYSNRIGLDDEAKEAFHVGKKKEITYSDMSKKLEKEISERPNDPISKAAFEKQMQDLADHQERQKQEMEAERAQQAFDALTPEEQVDVMNYAQQREQAEEAAMQEQAMAQEAMAQQQMAMQQPMQEVPQEPMPQEQMAVPTEGNITAEGGEINRFDYGGALKWIKQKYPQMQNKEAAARYLSRFIESDKDKHYYDVNDPKKVLYDKAWDFLNFSVGNAGKQSVIQKWMNLGATADEAFDFAFPSKTERNRAWVKDLYNNVVRQSSAAPLSYENSNGVTLPWNEVASQTQFNAPVNYTASSRNINNTASTGSKPSTNSGKKQWEASDGSVHNTKKEADAVNNNIAKVTHTPKVESKPVKQNSKVSSNNNRRAAVSRTTTPTANRGDIVNYKYDWYRNGSDGITETPWGFTPDSNGLIDVNTGYTDDYRNLVSALSADDIREWAANHPNDPSLLSFLAANGKDALANLTDDQWRKGATDGKYGFMHHVAAQIGQDQLPSEEQLMTDYNIIMNNPNGVTAEMLNNQPSGRIYHRVEGADDYLPNDPSGWNNVGSEIRREVTPDGDTIIWHAPGNLGGKDGMTFTEEQLQQAGNNIDGINGWDVKPNYKNEDLRYAGLLGPAVGLGLMAAGVGKPNKGAFDAVLNAYDGSGLALADYRPLGNYMTYRPMDMWAEQNRMNANARATDRALSNTNSPSRAAGLLANAYNNQVASGQLYRQGLEHNNNLNEKVQTFNRQTDQYNADAYNRVALANADAINRDRQYRAQLAMGIEGQKAAMDQGWYNSLYGNVGGIFKGLADVGRENAQHNMIAEMAANGLFGPMSPNTKVGRKGKYLTFTPTYVAKKGGKLNRKKGGK